MATGLLNNQQEPTPKFDEMVQSILRGFWMIYKQPGPPGCGFIVPAVTDYNRHVSYWGILDINTMPEEDVYIEMWRRFYSAIDHLGQEQIAGFGLMDVHQVLERQPLPEFRLS